MWGSRPASCREYGSDDIGEPARLEHLSPSCSQRDPSRRRGVEVAGQVVPSLQVPLVAESSVELNQESMIDVLDIALRGPGLDPLLSLTPRFGQSMRALDVQQVATLQHRQRP